MPNSVTDHELVFGDAIVFVKLAADPPLPFVVSSFAQRLSG